MDELFRGRYRVATARCSSWDYGSEGYYFVTVCTRDRIPCLADVRAGQLELTAAGEIVLAEWEATPILRPGIEVDSLVIMPNHFHAIVGLTRGTVPPGPRRWRRNVLGSIVNAVKAASSRRVRLEVIPEFAWQARFHDRIIRSEDHLERARHYMADNPRRWIETHQELGRAIPRGTV